RAFGFSAYRQSGTAEIHRRGPKMRPTFFGQARGRKFEADFEGVFAHSCKRWRPRLFLSPAILLAIGCRAFRPASVRSVQSNSRSAGSARLGREDFELELRPHNREPRRGG